MRKIVSKTFRKLWFSLVPILQHFDVNLSSNSFLFNVTTTTNNDKKKIDFCLLNFYWVKLAMNTSQWSPFVTTAIHRPSKLVSHCVTADHHHHPHRGNVVVTWCRRQRWRRRPRWPRARRWGGKINVNIYFSSYFHAKQKQASRHVGGFCLTTRVTRSVVIESLNEKPIRRILNRMKWC